MRLCARLCRRVRAVRAWLPTENQGAPSVLTSLAAVEIQASDDRRSAWRPIADTYAERGDARAQGLVRPHAAAHRAGRRAHAPPARLPVAPARVRRGLLPPTRTSSTWTSAPSAAGRASSSRGTSPASATAELGRGPVRPKIDSKFAPKRPFEQCSIVRHLTNKRGGEVIPLRKGGCSNRWPGTCFEEGTFVVGDGASHGCSATSKSPRA